jgi:hypothetical protein
MTDQALDFPLPLALRAYANHPEPAKRAERDHQEFIADLAETRAALEGGATTPLQRDLLDANMVVYRRGYLARMAEVWKAREQTPENTGDDRRLSAFGQAHLSFMQWQRKTKKDMQQQLLDAGEPRVSRWRDQVAAVADSSMGRGV